MTHDLVEPVDRSEAFEDAREAPDEVGVAAGPAWQQSLHRLTSNPRFGSLVIGVILLNAASLGLGTYPRVEDRAGDLLHVLDDVFLGFFVAELTLRLAAVGFRPSRFLRRGWNVFDLIAVGASFVPGLGSNATALRLVRLLRVARLLSVLPDVRVLLDGLRRAARPAAGILLLTMLLMYLYAIVGWSLFAEHDPKHWGNLGDAFLTLFQLLTLDQWPDVLEGVREASPYAILYILSFIVLGGFIVIELLIGVVITSLDQAHEAHRKHVLKDGTAEDIAEDDLTESIAVLRAALDELEQRAALP